MDTYHTSTSSWSALLLLTLNQSRKSWCKCPWRQQRDIHTECMPIHLSLQTLWCISGLSSTQMAAAQQVLEPYKKKNNFLNFASRQHLDPTTCKLFFLFLTNFTILLIIYGKWRRNCRNLNDQKIRQTRTLKWTYLLDESSLLTSLNNALSTIQATLCQMGHDIIINC